MHFSLVILLVFQFGAVFSQQQGCWQGGTFYPSACSNNFTKESEFWAFSSNHAFVPPTNPGRTIVGPGTKVLFDFRAPPAAPGFWFADAATYPSHSNLIDAIHLDYAKGNSYQVSYDTTQFWRCDFQSYILPNGEPFFGFTYNFGRAVTEKMMIDACNLAAPGVTIRFKAKVGIMSLDPALQSITPAAKAHCESLGFTMLTAAEVLNAGGTDPFLPLHTGEAYGTLRQFPANSSLLAATDIPVFNYLPNDLSVVSGVVTSVFQTVNSHVNLKSGERNTPNMILLNYDRYPCIQSFVNRTCHLSVASYGWSLENSTAAEVDAKFKQRLAEKKWLALYHNTERNILSYDEMCSATRPADCLDKKKIYGTKASSLGFLRNAKVLGKASDAGSLSAQYGYDITPVGFGIPFQLYVDFINYPANANIRGLIAELNQMEMTREPLPEERFNISTLLKEAFYKATIPPAVLATIQDSIDRYLTPIKINELKFRSSSNAEDLPGFDGAGLYDSYSALVGTKTPKEAGISPCKYDPSQDDMDPPSLECALKGIYGSLWNQRAIEERTFARYRHDSCVMGIAVIPKYKELGKVTANAVSISRLITGNTEKPGYSLSCQDGDNDVTNPEPGTQSETTFAVIKPDLKWDFQLQIPAIITKGGLPLSTFVINQSVMDDMMRVIIASEKAYCTYKFNLTKDDCDKMPLNNVKTALDQEFKILDGTRIHCKQLREFSGTRKTLVTLPTNNTCGWTDPAYFAPINGISYNNVALKRKVTGGTPRTVSVATGNGGTTVVTAFANKSVDGYVVDDSTVVTAVDTFLALEFDLPYTIKYIRFFWCKTFAGAAYTHPAINVAFNYSNGTSTFTSNVAIPVVTAATQLINVSVINATAARLTWTSGFLCVAEVQFLALPYILGDPNDFILENRTDTSDCVWDNWSPWSKCTADCAGGTTTRTRGGKWCVNYVTLDVSEETKACNTFVCPVDCIWNTWSEWSACSSCKWSNRSRTFIPPIGTGNPCDGSPIDNKECILNEIPCLLAPPVEFQIEFGSEVNTSEFSDAIERVIASLMNIDPGQVNAYLKPMSGNNTHRVIISFNGPTPQLLTYTEQDLLARQLSSKITSDSNFNQLFTNSSATISQLSPGESALQSYGLTYSNQDSNIPFWVWIIVGVVGLAIVVLVAVAIVCGLNKREQGWDNYAQL